MIALIYSYICEIVTCINRTMYTMLDKTSTYLTRDFSANGIMCYREDGKRC